MVEQTGLAKEQIKQSVLNAAGAFDWIADNKTINLVAMDSETHKDINITFVTRYSVQNFGVLRQAIKLGVENRTACSDPPLQ